MKNIIDRIKRSFTLLSNTIKKYLDWSLKNRFKGFLSLVLIGILVYVIGFLVTPRITASELTMIEEGYASPVLEEISLVSNLGLSLGEILVYEDEASNTSMFLNTNNSNVRIYNSDLDESWNTTLDMNRAFDQLKVYDIEAMAQLFITYYGNDGSSSKWNIFENSVIPGNYTVNSIENGIQFVFDVRDVKSVNLFEFIPQEISKERYESIFIDGISNADISEGERQNLENTFNYVYRFNEEKNSYYYRLATTPQLAMIEYLILSTELFEYTQDDVINDNKEFGITTVFIERPHFEVTLELTIDNGDLIVNIPTGAIVNHSDYFEIISMDVLPNFGGADYQYKDGFVFVPDGSGAIIDIEGYQSIYPKYKKPIYDNNRFYDIYHKREYSEDIMMPIFGMVYKKGGLDTLKGFLGIVETGEELGYVNAQVTDGYSLSQAFSSFDTVQSTYSKTFGPYALQDNLYRSSTPFHNFNYQVRYILLDESQSTYYEMSQIYQDYLIDKYDLSQKFTDQKLHLEILGSLSVTERFMGIPYENVRTYTTGIELDAILTDLKYKASVNYRGVFNTGIKNDLYNKVDIVKEIEDEISLKNLLEKYPDIYLGLDLTKSYSNENGMKDAYAVHDFYGGELDIGQYNIATGRFENKIETKTYNIVSPKYLKDLVGKFLDERDPYILNLAFGDLGSEFYADYKRTNYISGMEAFNEMHDAFSQFESFNMILPDPFVEFIQYANLITDMNRVSSEWGGFTESIPFKQLVFSGLIPFTTEDVNFDTSYRYEYYTLQYIELGSLPKFFISSQNTVDLKVTEYNDYYSISYDEVKEKIRLTMTEIDVIDSLLTSRVITNHSIITNNVFMTVYNHSTSVYTNYNDYEITITTNLGNEIILDAYGYYIE